MARALRAAGAEDAAKHVEGNSHTRLPPVQVDADNASSFRVFTACETQWDRLVVTGAKKVVIVRTGLDYVRAESAARALGVEWNAATLSDLRIMEAAAITAWAKDAR